MFKHHFHENCISEWMGRGKSTCPLCRKKIEALNELIFTAEELELTRQRPANDRAQQQPALQQDFHRFQQISLTFIEQTGELLLNAQEQQDFPIPAVSFSDNPQQLQGNITVTGNNIGQLPQMLQMIQQQRQLLQERRTEIVQEAIESNQRQQQHGSMF